MIDNESAQRTKEYLARRKAAYKAAFDGPKRVEVLADLAKFCRANTSTASQDPYITAALNGRREVWLRIQEHIQLTEAELWKLYGGPGRMPE